MHVNKETVALAAKLARLIWVVLTKPGATCERRMSERALGRTGEERVLPHQRSMLRSPGLDELARRGRWVSAEDGDGFSPTACRLLQISGPLAHDHVEELMGIPELTAHSKLVSARLAEALARDGAAFRAPTTVLA